MSIQSHNQINQFMKHVLPRFRPEAGEAGKEARSQVNMFISANAVGRYRDGSEGKVKPFKPSHYSSSLSAV
jgi:hypothetical protein